MITWKCRYCGEDLQAGQESGSGICARCGAVRVLPGTAQGRGAVQLNRGDRLLARREFDRAGAYYASAASASPEESEAWWGQVLCRCGAFREEGVLQLGCARPESVEQCSAFGKAMETASSEARKIYREEGTALERLRKEIVEAAGREPAWDIILCCLETDREGNSTRDGELAQKISDALAQRGWRVFRPGLQLRDCIWAERESAIFAALQSARLMLVVGTDYEHWQDPWVRSLWNRSLERIHSGKGGLLVPCFEGIDAFDMPREFADLTAWDLGRPEIFAQIPDRVDQLLGRRAQSAGTEELSPAQARIQTLLRRSWILLGNGDWKDAREQANMVLDLDPEQGEAYGLLVLAEQECPDWERFVALQEERLHALVPLQVAIEVQNGYVVQNVVEKYQVGDLTGEKIRQRFPELRPIESLLKPTADLKAETEEFFAGNGNWNRALRFSQGELHRQFEQVRNTVLDRLAQAVSEAERRQQADMEQASRTFQMEYQAAEEEISAACEAEKKRLRKLEEDKKAAISAQYREYEHMNRWAREIGQNIAAGTVGYVLRDPGHCVTLYADDIKEESLTFPCKIIRSARETATLFLISEENELHVRRDESDPWLNSGFLQNVQEYKKVTDLTAGRYYVVLNRGLQFTMVSQKDHAVEGACFPARTGFRQVAAARNITAFLYGDGTVTCTGSEMLARELESWKDIRAIDAAADFVVGLRKNGTVAVAGSFPKEAREEIQRWYGIVDVCAGSGPHIVGLRANGAVLAAGNNDYGQCDTYNWKNIVGIATGAAVTLGIEEEGGVCIVGTSERIGRRLTRGAAQLSLKLAMDTDFLKASGGAKGRFLQEIGQFWTEDDLAWVDEKIHALVQEMREKDQEVKRLHGPFSQKRRDALKAEINALYDKVKFWQAEQNGNSSPPAAVLAGWNLPLDE